jgi:hypothetical protein
VALRKYESEFLVDVEIREGREHNLKYLRLRKGPHLIRYLGVALPALQLPAGHTVCSMLPQALGSEQ